MMRSTARAALLLSSSPFFCLTGAACSVPSAVDAETSEAATTVHPTGDSSSATLTIELPVEISDPAAFTIWLDSPRQRLQPGIATRVALAPNSRGLSSITIEHGENRYQELYSVPVGQTTIVRLGAVRIEDEAATRPTLDLTGNVDEQESLGDFAHESWQSLNLVWGDARYPKWSGPTSLADLRGVVLPLRAGHYELDPAGDTTPRVAFDITEGRLTTTSFGPSPFAWVELQREAASFPDAGRSLTRIVCGKNVAFGTDSGVARPFESDRASIYIKAQATCRLDVSGAQSDVFTVDPLQRVAIPVKRLEIDHVTLTDEAPGTQIAGTYDVHQWFPGGRLGARIAAGATKTGLSLPAGLYHIVVRYTSPLGKSGSYTQDIQL